MSIVKKEINSEAIENLQSNNANDNQKINALFNNSRNEILKFRGDIMDLFCRVENEVGNILYKLANNKNYKLSIRNVQPQLGSMISSLNKLLFIEGEHKNNLKPLLSAFQDINVLFEMRAVFAHAKVDILINKDLIPIYVFEIIRFENEKPQIIKIHYEAKSIKENKLKLNQLLQKLSTVNNKIK